MFVLSSADGSNYETWVNADPPDDAYVGSFKLYAQTGTQRALLRQVPLPARDVKFVLKNRSGSAALPASGSQLLVLPYTEASV